MLEDSLKLLGLTTNEINVYLTVLKLGRVGATELRTAAKIAHSRVYAALDTLIEKGLVTYEKQAGGKKYNALDPEVIHDLVEKRNKKIEESIPLLKKLQQPLKPSTETAVFEGMAGFKNALLHTIQGDKPVHIKLIGFSAQEYNNEKLTKMLDGVNIQSMQRGDTYQVILDEENPWEESRRALPGWDVRVLGNGFKNPCAIGIYDKMVGFWIWDEKPYAILVYNKNLVDSFNTYFDFLWALGD